jgi:hypothetical protein
MIVKPPLPRLAFPLFTLVAGTAAIGAVALYRMLTRRALSTVVHSPGGKPRTTVMVQGVAVESDGPERERCEAEVPW